MKRQKLLLIIPVVLVLVFLLFLVDDLRNGQLYTSTVEIEAVPSDSIITLDGKKIGQGMTNIKPGEHKINVQRKGFNTKSKSITALDGKELYIGISLETNDNTGKSYLNNHPEELKKIEGISSKNFDASSENISDKYPLISKLPHVDLSFKIDYGNSSTQSRGVETIIYIQALKPVDRQLAIDWIKGQGFNISDYTIVFVDAPIVLKGDSREEQDFE